MLGGAPSRAIPSVARVEHRFPFVRVRVWFAEEGGHLWMSPGYVTITLPRYLVLRARSKWRRWRDFPTATVRV